MRNLKIKNSVRRGDFFLAYLTLLLLKFPRKKKFLIASEFTCGARVPRIATTYSGFEASAVSKREPNLSKKNCLLYYHFTVVRLF